MSSNMTVIPGMNLVPTILTIAPPAAEPKAGMTAVTVGLSVVPPGDGASGDAGDGEHPDIPQVRPMTKVIEPTDRIASRIQEVDRELKLMK